MASEERMGLFKTERRLSTTNGVRGVCGGKVEQSWSPLAIQDDQVKEGTGCEALKTGPGCRSCRGRWRVAGIWGEMHEGEGRRYSNAAERKGVE